MCVAVDYSFFSPDFSMKRKVAAAASLTIAVALATIFALGIANVELFAGITAPETVIFAALGTVVWLTMGIALAGCKVYDGMDVILLTLDAMGTVAGAGQELNNPRGSE